MEEQASIREAELRFEMDKLRLAKRELEGRVGGVDLQEMASEHVRLSSLEEELRSKDQAHRAELASLQAKLKWYTENQQLIDEIEARSDAHQARARALEALLETAPAAAQLAPNSAPPTAPLPPSPKGTEGARGVSESERVQLLERQVRSLQRLLEARGEGRGGKKSHPRAGLSVAELVAAAGPSPEEVQRMEYLSGRVEQLEEQCAEIESSTQRRLRSLRQQHERVVSGYESRLSSVTAALKKMEAAEAAHGKSGSTRVRVRELEKQLEEVCKGAGDGRRGVHKLGVVVGGKRGAADCMASA